MYQWNKINPILCIPINWAPAKLFTSSVIPWIFKYSLLQNLDTEIHMIMVFLFDGNNLEIEKETEMKEDTQNILLIK